MTLTGNCVVCGKFLDEESYNRQEVVAAMGPEGTVVCCVAHLKGGQDNPEYITALEKIALAKAGQLCGKN